MSLIARNLAAEQIGLSARALGFEVAKIQIANDEAKHILTVRTTSTYTSSVFPSLDNTYISYYTNGFLPFKLQAQINQHNKKETYSALLNHKEGKAYWSDSHADKPTVVNITPESRDVFSVLMLLRTLPPEGSYPLDGNGKIWNTQSTYLRKEKVLINDKTYNCQVVRATFHGDPNIKPYFKDMVIGDLLVEGRKMDIWLADELDNLPVKAVIYKFPFNIDWIMTQYKP